MSDCSSKRGDKYNKITQEQKELLIHKVEYEAMSLKKAAHEIGINPNTAKSIYQKYRRYGTNEHLKTVKLKEQMKIEKSKEDFIYKHKNKPDQNQTQPQDLQFTHQKKQDLMEQIFRNINTIFFEGQIPLTNDLLQYMNDFLVYFISNVKTQIQEQSLTIIENNDNMMNQGSDCANFDQKNQNLQKNLEQIQQIQDMLNLNKQCKNQQTLPKQNLTLTQNIGQLNTFNNNFAAQENKQYSYNNADPLGQRNQQVIQQQLHEDQQQLYSAITNQLYQYNPNSNNNFIN